MRSPGWVAMNDRKVNIDMSECTSPSLFPHRLDPVLFKKIVDLLAEVLVQDYQSHPNITDNSHPQTNRK